MLVSGLLFHLSALVHLVGLQVIHTHLPSLPPTQKGLTHHSVCWVAGFCGNEAVGLSISGMGRHDQGGTSNARRPSPLNPHLSTPHPYPSTSNPRPHPPLLNRLQAKLEQADFLTSIMTTFYIPTERWMEACSKFLANRSPPQPHPFIFLLLSLSSISLCTVPSPLCILSALPLRLVEGESCLRLVSTECLSSPSTSCLNGVCATSSHGYASLQLGQAVTCIPCNASTLPCDPSTPSPYLCTV